MRPGSVWDYLSLGDQAWPRWLDSSFSPLNFLQPSLWAPARASVTDHPCQVSPLHAVHISGPGGTTEALSPERARSEDPAGNTEQVNGRARPEAQGPPPRGLPALLPHPHPDGFLGGLHPED